MKIIPYVRIYFNRGTSRGVVDTGPGTQSVESADLRFSGKGWCEFADSQDCSVRPRFWLAMRNVVLIRERYEVVEGVPPVDVGDKSILVIEVPDGR